MKQDILFKEVERIAKKNKLMELHYDVESFPAGEPYFTTTQETDIRELIMEGVNKHKFFNKFKWHFSHRFGIKNELPNFVM